MTGTARRKKTGDSRGARQIVGIDPALITCDDDNVASRRVIEANGGVYEDQGGVKLRFWMPTSVGRPAE